MPYFLKAEGHASRNGAFHGRSGPLRVRKGSSPNPLYPAFVRSGVEAGFAECEDFNRESQEGFGQYDYTIRRGRRWSVARAYPGEARRRSNLRVVTRAYATRISFEGRRAVGVEYRRFRKNFQANADAEL
ncbi:GMC family oxidoreductase N-terminal domain-containing protein [Bradyrhizobium sp. 76]|nr:GMC family oxidoreductase N-terminal domain-containing protein [Bradyrhizobium sp. 76]